MGEKLNVKVGDEGIVTSYHNEMTFKNLAKVIAIYKNHLDETVFAVLASYEQSGHGQIMNYFNEFGEVISNNKVICDFKPIKE